VKPSTFEDLWSSERGVQNAAYADVLRQAEEPVDWAYDVWDEVVARLSDADNHNRSIAGQLLARLAVSDPDKRILHDLPSLVAVTRDKRFVTARHTVQSIWRVGIAGGEQRTALVAALRERFAECAAEKNCTLIRYDIIKTLHDLYSVVGDESVRETALQLIETETDAKYRKKYAGIWK